MCDNLLNNKGNVIVFIKSLRLCVSSRNTFAYH